MISLDGNDITLTRGDTMNLEIEVTDNKGTAVTFESGDKVYFTVKKTASTKEKAIQKVITEFTSNIIKISLTALDTKKLEYGKYEYDIQISDIHGNTITPIKAYFIISEEVTFDL